MVITETNGCILYVNPAFEKDTGYTAEEVLGRNPRLLKSGRHGKEFFRDMWMTIERGEVWQGHLIDRRKDGSLFDVHQIITPISDAGGRIVNFVSVWRDVTRERQLEEQVRQSQKMDGIGRLASGIAHDFNNVLAAMIGYGEMLQVKARAQPDLAGYIGEILSNANRASNLTRQLLAFSRRQAHEIQPVNLNDVLRQMHALLRRSLTNDIELVTLFGEGIGNVRGDFGQLEQVILNLAINGRDAMAGRGGAKLVIETQRCQISEEEAAAMVDAAPGDYVMVSVRDNGQGMSAEVRQHVFEPFYTTKPEGQGTGLGVAVVYGIVRQHQGWIELETEEDVGTEFRVFIPRTDEQGNDKEKAEEEEELTGTERVLVIDDEQNVLDLLLQLLASLGYDAVGASSGAEGVARVAEGGREFDIVICDVVMPHMSGLETVKRIREMVPGIKTLLISGYANFSDDDDASMGQGSDRTPLMLKPFNRARLAQKVRFLLDGESERDS